MKKYIIWASSLKLDSGGVTVLHLLADMINNMGYKAYLWPGDNNFETFLTNLKYNISLAKKDMINDDAIIIYPEIVIGNPLNAKNVVRWLLNKPGKLGGDGIFGPDDALFYFSDAFTEGEKNLNYLHINEFYGDMFVDLHLNRQGSCYVMRKGKGRKIIHDTSNSIEITDCTPSEELVRIFNERKFFYCYDIASFLALQAALCGCISIVVPVDGLKAEEWIGMSETRKFGIAYGEENIEHAVMTMDKVRPHLKELQLDFINGVKSFIEKTQELFKSKDKEITSSFIPEPLQIKTNTILVSEAETLIDQGKLNKAKEILEQIINEDPSNITVLNNLSAVAILEKNYKKAEEITDKILQIDKTNIIALDNYEFLQELNFKIKKEKSNDTHYISS